MANERVIHIGTELDTSGMYAGINRIRQMLGSIDVDSNLFKDINKDLDKITKLSLNVGTALKNGIPQKDMKSFIKDTDEISKLYSALPAKIRQISIETGNIHFPKDVANRLDEIDIEVEKLNTDIKKTLGSDLRDSIRNAIPTNIISNKTLDNLLKGKDVVGAFEDELVKAQAAATKTEGALRDLIGTFRNSGQTNRAAFAGLLEESLNNGTLPTNKDSLIGFTDDLEKEQTKAINAINNYNEARERSIALEQSYAQVTQIVSNAQAEAAQKTQQANALHQEREDKINDTLQKNINAHKNTVTVIDEVSEKESAGMKEVGESASKANTHLQHQDSLLKQIASRATSLIGIGAVFNYITRGIRDAWNGIKDLDKEFTQIAVVTDKTTSQLWSSYGTYSQMAQGLGVATKDAVATSALYYQQGLDTADVMTLTAETIKMAQIAGMDFATATNQMTAAIRGFNLEMNQASMVNDIFSTLAANAAVSTQELSYALTKTASIAESAGMSIDTTSAFLTKMIETTREAPENIGTAMKSIVARFEELKKNPLALTVDVEGEEVVANKVEAAIALAGVKLRDASGQFRDLDDVFLELAKSWDGLDRNTQRYIATIAAGSRQQSRFIALMDGYDRTLELTEIAQDSEGQSAAQFLKTLDSLDSKLNRVGNSLEQLYQKFVNSDFFGGLIDSLNDLLQKLGKLDAGTLAAMAVVGITLANTIIKTFGNTVKAWSNNGLSDLIGSKITKIKDSVEKPSLVNRINNRSISKIQEKTKQSKAELEERNKIKIEVETKEAKARVEELKKEIKDLTEKQNNNVEIDVEVKKKKEEELSNLNKEINNIQKRGQAELIEETKKLEEKEKAQIEQTKKGLSTAMSTVGPALMSALSVGITTAIATKDPWEAFTNSMLTFATVIIPSLFTQIGTAIGNGARTAGEIFTSIGGPWALIITGIAAGLSALIPLASAWIANIKTESQQLEETLDQLKDRQQALEENAEKLNAESSVSKIQYKHLNKLVDSYDTLIHKTNRTADENERLEQTIEDLGKDFPDLIDHYNEAGEAVLKQRYEWDKIVADQKESAKLAMNKAAGANLMADLNSAQIANVNTKLAAAQSRERLESLSADFTFDPNALMTRGYQLMIAEGKEKQLLDTLKTTNFNSKEDTNALKQLILNTNTQKYGGATELGWESYWDFSPKNTGSKLDKYLGIESTGIFDNLVKKYNIASEELIKETLEVPATKLFETREDLDNYINSIENSNIRTALSELDGDTKETLLNSFQNLYHDIENEVNSYNKDYQSEETKKALRAAQEHLAEYFTSYIQSFEPEAAANISDKGMERLSKSFAKSKVGNLKDLDSFLTNYSTGSQVANALKQFTDARGQSLISKLTYNNNGANTADMSEEEYNALQEAYQNYLTSQQEKMAEAFATSIKEFKSKVDNGEFSQESYDTLMSDLGTKNSNQLNQMLEDIKASGDMDLFNEMAEQVDQTISSLDNLSPAFRELGLKYGVNIAQGLNESKVSDQFAQEASKIFEGLDEEKLPGIIEVIGKMDFGNFTQLKQLAALFVEAGDGAEQAAEDVMNFVNAMGGATSLKINKDYFNSYFTELGKTVQDAAKEYKDLYSAMEEYKDMGRLSAQTIIDLVASGKAEYLVLDENTGALKLNTQAIEDNWHAEMEAATASLDMEIAKQEAAQAGLKIQLEVEKRKLEILQNAKKRGGAITAAEYTELKKLDDAYSVDILNNQINLNTESLIQDGKFFTDLLESREKGYGQLVQQAVHYGQQIQEALVSGATSGGTFTPTIDLSNAWAEQEKENRKASAKAKIVSGTSEVYTYDPTELDALMAQEDDLIKALEGEIADRDKVLKQLEDTKSKIRDITVNSSFADYMKDTGKATKDAKKELEDYTSTLERYYTLTKRVEKAEKERQKALKQYKKTGSKEDFDEYYSKTEEWLTGLSQKAYVGKEEKIRSMDKAKKELKKYFTDEELKLLQFDEKTGQVDLDSFHESKAYKAKSQDDKAGKSIDESLKTLTSDVEKYQGWIDDFDDATLEVKDEFEELQKEARKIVDGIDRLADIERALESIQRILDESAALNEEYYATGGREGINGAQHLRNQAESIQTQDLYQAELAQAQLDKAKLFKDRDWEKYVEYNKADNKYYTNTDAFNALGSQGEKGRDLQTEINNLANSYNELTNKVKDSEKAQRDSAKAMREFTKSLKKAYSDLITRVADDMAKLDQKEIDEVKKKYAMIQEEDDKYLEALQKSIDKQRQLREQAKSYDDLEKDEKRLALLERDTSGANAAEIAALREQIKDKRQNLVDTEQDNIVNKISEENKNRKDKMDEETKFLQNVMDERTYDMQYYLDKARDIVDAAINGDAGAYQQMLKIMQEAEEGYFKATKEAQDEFIQTFESSFKQAQDWVTIASEGYGDITKSTISEIENLSRKMGDSSFGANTLASKIEAVDEKIKLMQEQEPFEVLNKSIETANEKLDEFLKKIDGKYDLEVEIVYHATGDVPSELGGGSTPDATEPNSLSGSGKYAVSRYDSASRKNIIVGYTNDESIAQMHSHLGGQGRYDLTSNLNIQTDQPEKYGYGYFKEEVKSTPKNQTSAITSKTKEQFTENDVNPNKYYTVDMEGNVLSENDKYTMPNQSTGLKACISGAELLESMTKEKLIYYKAFAKGGLVDFTGPAWVDGTKTDPEAFLTAEDTRNIQALTSILQNVLSPTTTPTPSDKSEVKAGDTNIEIHIDVEKIEDDYDVEQMLDTIESRISEASKGQVTIVK